MAETCNLHLLSCLIWMFQIGIEQKICKIWPWLDCCQWAATNRVTAVCFVLDVNNVWCTVPVKQMHIFIKMNCEGVSTPEARAPLVLSPRRRPCIGGEGRAAPAGTGSLRSWCHIWPAGLPPWTLSPDPGPGSCCLASRQFSSGAGMVGAGTSRSLTWHPRSPGQN